MAYRVWITLHDEGEVVDARGKVWRFIFAEYGGPLVVDRNGNDVKKQPGERSPFWPAFAEWEKAWRVARDLRQREAKAKKR